MLWDAEQSDRHPSRSLGTCIASQSLCPGEPRMGTLCAGKGCRLDSQARRSGRPDLDLDATFRAGAGYRRVGGLDDSSPARGAAHPQRQADGAGRSPGAACAFRSPCHWHCSRRGQGRQLRMLAAYTTRRLPSVSLRCSCGISFWSAGHRSVPSSWRAKSWPEKRPAFQEIAVVGGPYPDAGARSAEARWSLWLWGHPGRSNWFRVRDALAVSPGYFVNQH